MGSIASGVFTEAQTWAPENRHHRFTQWSLWSHPRAGRRASRQGRTGTRSKAEAAPMANCSAEKEWRAGDLDRGLDGICVRTARRKKEASPGVAPGPGEQRAGA